MNPPLNETIKAKVIRMLEELDAWQGSFDDSVSEEGDLPDKAHIIGTFLKERLLDSTDYELIGLCEALAQKGL